MLLAALLALAAQQAAAMPMGEQPAPCPAAPAPLPDGLEGWASPAPAKAGAGTATATPLTLGAAVQATLLPTPQVHYAAPPEKPGEPGTHGGVFAFTVAAAGRYRVGLGAGAWVDVLAGTTPVASAAHGHGPACSTLRKMVDFDLKPGRYELQVAGNATSTLALIVARLP